LEALFSPEAAILEASEGRSDAELLIGVDPEGACLDGPRNSPRLGDGVPISALISPLAGLVVCMTGPAPRTQQTAARNSITT